MKVQRERDTVAEKEKRVRESDRVQANSEETEGWSRNEIWRTEGRREIGRGREGEIGRETH